MESKQRRTKDRNVRAVEFAFYNETEIRSKVREARQEAVNPEVRIRGALTDPTAVEVIRNLTPIKSIWLKGVEMLLPERWLEVIDRAYTWSKKRGLYEIARRRYSGEYYRKICIELFISENTFYSALNNFRTYALIQAAQLNLIFFD